MGPHISLQDVIVLVFHQVWTTSEIIKDVEVVVEAVVDVVVDNGASHGRVEHVPGLPPVHAQTYLRVRHCVHVPSLSHQGRAGPRQTKRRYVIDMDRLIVYFLCVLLH